MSHAPAQPLKVTKILADGWLAFLAILAVFVVHDVATGVSFGGGTIGGVIGGIVAGGQAFLTPRPNLSPWQRRFLLAAIGTAASVTVLALLHALKF